MSEEHWCVCPGTIPNEETPCGQPMTQEDLLCDRCRAGCAEARQQYVDIMKDLYPGWPG